MGISWADSKRSTGYIIRVKHDGVWHRRFVSAKSMSKDDAKLEAIKIERELRESLGLDPNIRRRRPTSVVVGDRIRLVTERDRKVVRGTYQNKDGDWRCFQVVVKDDGVDAAIEQAKQKMIELTRGAR